MTELPKRELGRTGLEVTMLGYGAMELRGAPRTRDISEAQAETILNAVLDSGINYIDTSIDYGLSEERIGRYIGHRRDEYYLASKCGCLVGAPPAPRGDRSPHVFTPENIVAGVEQSLRRMQTDHLDVVQFHSSPSQQTLQDNGAVDALLSWRADRCSRTKKTAVFQHPGRPRRTGAAIHLHPVRPGSRGGTARRRQLAGLCRTVGVAFAILGWGWRTWRSRSASLSSGWRRSSGFLPPPSRITRLGRRR